MGSAYSDEPGVLAVHFAGGEADIQASISTRVAVLTFPEGEEVDASLLDAGGLALLDDVEISEAENGLFRLTLVGADGSLASHRRDGTTLHIAFRTETQADVAETEAARSPWARQHMG